VTSPDAVLLWRVHGQGNGENLSPPPPPHFATRLVLAVEKSNFEARLVRGSGLRLYIPGNSGCYHGVTEGYRRRG